MLLVQDPSPQSISYKLGLPVVTMFNVLLNGAPPAAPDDTVNVTSRTYVFWYILYVTSFNLSIASAILSVYTISTAPPSPVAALLFAQAPSDGTPTIIVLPFN